MSFSGKKLCFKIFLFFSLVFSLAGRAHSINAPERLEYVIKWQGIPAGSASLEYSKTGNGSKIVSTAESSKWVSVFYKVDDRVESRMDGDFFPLNYRINLNEGRHRKLKEVRFKQSEGKAKHIDLLSREEKDYDTKGRAYDPLSAFYRVRSMELKAGRPVFLNVFDSKRLWNLEVQVIKKERVEIPLGHFDTILIKPLLESDGIFSRKGEILIWLTDDERKIPVRMQSKVKIGHVTAELVGGSF